MDIDYDLLNLPYLIRLGDAAAGIGQKELTRSTTIVSLKLNCGKSTELS